MFSNRDEMDFNNDYGVTTMQQHSLRTFGWMGVGLTITAVVAFVLGGSNFTLRLLYGFPMLPIILMIAQIGVAIAFGARLSKMHASTAKVLFIAYAVLMGVTFSTLAYVYDLGSIAIAFAITAVYFGSLVFIGMTTKINLMRFGPILMGGLITLIIAEVIMMFMGMDINTMLFSAIGLLLFTAITAYDAQKMKALYTRYENDEVMLSKLAIYSAFDLYLDFINIFLYILRFVGNKD